MQLDDTNISTLASLIATQVINTVTEQTTVVRWLKLKKAAEYSAMNEKRLIELAQEGRVVGFQDPDNGRRDWIFDRVSLDLYRESQAPITAREKALDIMRTLEPCSKA